MTIETSGMRFEAPDPEKDTMGEDKERRLSELLAAAGREEDRYIEREGGDAQKCRAYAFLASRYAEDNAVSTEPPDAN